MENSEMVSLFYQGCSIDGIASLLLAELKSKYEHGEIDNKPNRLTARKIVEIAIYKNIMSGKGARNSGY